MSWVRAPFRAWGVRLKELAGQAGRPPYITPLPKHYRVPFTEVNGETPSSTARGLIGGSLRAVRGHAFPRAEKHRICPGCLKGRALRETERILAVDHLARASMKSAASCDT